MRTYQIHHGTHYALRGYAAHWQHCIWAPSTPGSPLPLVTAQQEHQQHIKTHVHIKEENKKHIKSQLRCCRRKGQIRNSRAPHWCDPPWRWGAHHLGYLQLMAFTKRRSQCRWCGARLLGLRRLSTRSWACTLWGLPMRWCWARDLWAAARPCLLLPRTNTWCQSPPNPTLIHLLTTLLALHFTRRSLHLLKSCPSLHPTKTLKPSQTRKPPTYPFLTEP